LVIIFIKLHSIEFFWQTVIGLKVSEIDLGKKLGFQAKLWLTRNLCTIQLVI